MDPPVARPNPIYPPNYASSRTPTTSTPQDSPVHATPPRKNSSGLSLPSLSGKKNQSFLSLASLNLAHSSSTLLGIFSSAMDSVPPSPLPSPPPEVPRERALIQEVDRWGFIRDTTRNISVLFGVGYAFAILLLSLHHNHALPFPYFQRMSDLAYFPLFSGASVVLMGCSIPLVDHYYEKYTEAKAQRMQDLDSPPLWERAEWSMPMRYLGGVVGFAWAASRLHWTSQVQLYAVIALAALALWFLFDRTGTGMGMSLLVGIGSWVVFMLIVIGGISHEGVDATGWMPSAVFSANIAFGNIGRKLFEREGHVVIRRRYSEVRHS